MGLSSGVPLDLDALQSWMDTQRLGSGPLAGATVLTGGTQNLLIKFERAGREYVIRTPSSPKRPGADETIQREIRVLRGIAGTAVPAPRLEASCEDLSVLGGAFYLMSVCGGFNPAEQWPDQLSDDPGYLAGFGIAMVRALLPLGEIEPRRFEAEGMRSPDGWLERQPDRWRRQFESYPTAASITGVARLNTWLTQRCPRQWQAGLIHGDFNLGNVLVSRSEPEVLAIVDWELATLGDPLLDLAHLLMTWPAGHGSWLYHQLDDPRLTSAGTMLEYYRAHSPRDVPDFSWYCVLACYRLGIILEGTHARATMSLAARDTGDRLHGYAVKLIGLAEDIVDGLAPV
ncbi:phosphotransferase family protein [Jatrophihabitans sp.]|uniref:phosphotransferase family protein n=1 Tax=Jatrophihabitans sp. TaxID=1932789 RepID=UPI0030C6C352|nr:phosphotransferase family protein [Jatrophihabitans sp.]